MLASSMLLVGCGTYSQGARVGIITKLSQKGYICKSWEGEMNVGAGNGNFSPTTWDFTVEDPDVIKALLQHQEKGDRVKLDYTEEVVVWPCRADTKYFITGVTAE